MKLNTRLVKKLNELLKNNKILFARNIRLKSRIDVLTEENYKLKCDNEELKRSKENFENKLREQTSERTNLIKGYLYGW